MVIKMQKVYGAKLNSLHALLASEFLFAWTIDPHIGSVSLDFSGVSCTNEFWTVFMNHVDPNDYSDLTLINATYEVKQFKKSAVILKRDKNT